MSMISYWSDVVQIYASNSFVVILGNYNHKNESEKGSQCLGLFWKSEEGGVGFPNARGHLSPMVLENRFNEGFLQFLLFQAIKDKNTAAIDTIKRAIDILL